MTTRILQLSDVHRFADPDERLFGIPTRELFEDVLAHVEPSGLRPDHVVMTGDHTHDELPETYAAVREELAPFLDRLWLVPGNHDDRAVLRAAFDDRIPGDGAGRVTFSFRAGDWLCLGLDTQVTGAVPSRSTGSARSSTSIVPARPCSSCTIRRSSSGWRGSTASVSRTPTCSRACS
jgi:Icc protein